MLSTEFRIGAPNWLDLGSPDIPASAAFYGSVFGWEFESAGSESGGYGFFRKGGRTVAGIGSLTEEGAHPAWTVYFATPDAEAVAKTVEQAGGTVRVEAFDVMDAGRMACFTDPTGAEFAVWQPAAHQGFEVASEDDTLLWVELHTPDPSAALAFYRALFGWRSQEMEVPGMIMSYSVISSADGDQEDTSFGGVAPARPDERTAWISYFGVADPDAVATRVVAGGGSVLVPASDIPEVGRMAFFADPAGAPFAVLKPNPRQQG
ncbi:VOC family protein [Streptomyces sp. NBC_00237]|uniref:VOC family protein n=1 Tax=Streptomyces sp. NBC_00237 TaxID=2975687 RepID=UPI002253000D|nr:VOC family protein [Streptomyces sp. NBC_00237]MCX5206628.1 VOC family protein [Streptomyces sp. NBC_00237]